MTTEPRARQRHGVVDATPPPRVPDRGRGRASALARARASTCSAPFRVAIAHARQRTPRALRRPRAREAWLACALLLLAACGGRARAAREALARGDTLLAVGEPHLALLAYEEVRHTGLYDAALPRMLAAHEEIGAFDRAQKLVDSALEVLPTDVDLRLAHARLTAARGDPQRAYEQVHALGQTVPDSPELLTSLAAFASGARERTVVAMRLATHCELASRRGGEAGRVGAELLLPLARLQEQLAQPEAASRTRADARRVGVKQPDLARQVAVVYARRGEGVLAEELLELMLRKRPEDVQSWRELARVRLGLRDWSGAEQALGHLQGTAAETALGRLLRARLQLGQGHAERALIPLRELAANAEVRRDAALHARVQLELGRALSASGDAAAAESAYLAALSGDPALEDAELALAELDLTQNRPARVLERLALFTEAHPHSAPAYRLLGRAQQALPNITEAVQSFRQLVSLTPGDPGAHELLASALLASGDAEAAQQELERALALDPAAIGPLTALNALLTEQGRSDRAENLIRIALSRRGRRPELLTLLGDNLLSQPGIAGNAAAAEQAYREASPERAPYAPALLALARLYQRQGQAAEELLALEAALPVAAEPAPLWLRVARLQAARGDGAEAKYAYEQVLAREPESAQALAELARVHAELLSQPSAAHSLAERAYGLAPEQPAVVGAFGWILLQQGHTDTALPLLREAAAAQPTSGEAQYELGMALMKRGDTREARALLDRARELSPALADARAAAKQATRSRR